MFPRQDIELSSFTFPPKSLLCSVYILFQTLGVYWLPNHPTANQQAAKASLASLRVRSSLLGGGVAPSHTAFEKRPPVAGKQPTCSSNGRGSESAVAATAVDNANGSARGAGTLLDPSSGAIVTQAGVLRRRQSNTPHPPLSTSPQPSSSAPLPLLELLSRLQDLLPSEVATREDPVPRHGLGDGRGVVDADEAIVAAAAVAATAAAGLAGVEEERSPSSTADNDGGGDGGRGVDDKGPRGKVPSNLDGGVFDEGATGTFAPQREVTGRCRRYHRLVFPPRASTAGSCPTPSRIVAFLTTTIRGRPRPSRSWAAPPCGPQPSELSSPPRGREFA